MLRLISLVYVVKDAACAVGVAQHVVDVRLHGVIRRASDEHQEAAEVVGADTVTDAPESITFYELGSASGLELRAEERLRELLADQSDLSGTDLPRRLASVGVGHRVMLHL